MSTLVADCRQCGKELWCHQVSYTEWAYSMCRDCYARQIVTEVFEEAKRNR